jgi:hypothetical protein
LTNILKAEHIAVMFVRSKSSVRNDASYEYLQIVRPYREGGKVRQQVIASLGRSDRLIASGELDGLPGNLRVLRRKPYDFFHSVAVK